MTGKVQPLSLMRRVEAFFVARPDEWLTYEDAAIQFGCTQSQLKAAIERLRKTGSVHLRVRSVVVRCTEEELG